MSEKQYIAEYDLSNLDLKITLDGKELDPRKVFSAWERSMEGAAQTPTPSPRPLHYGTDARITQASLRSMIGLTEDALSEMSSTDSNVSDQFDSAISAIEHALRNAVRDILVECVSDHSVSEPTYDAYRTVERLRDQLQELEQDEQDE
jgi:hypothetical protein